MAGVVGSVADEYLRHRASMARCGAVAGPRHAVSGGSVRVTGFAAIVHRSNARSAPEP
jgi:hypothetical protein